MRGNDKKMVVAVYFAHISSGMGGARIHVEFIEDFFLSKQSLGTFAYAIDSSMYDEILNQSIGKSVDNVLSDMQNKYYGECYTFYPNICVSDVSESDIRSDRDQESHSKRMRWDLLKNYI